MQNFELISQSQDSSWIHGCRCVEGDLPKCILSIRMWKRGTAETLNVALLLVGSPSVFIKSQSSLGSTEDRTPRGQNIQYEAVVWKKIPFYCCCTTRQKKKLAEQAWPVLGDEADLSAEVDVIFFPLSILCCKHDAVLLVGNFISPKEVARIATLPLSRLDSSKSFCYNLSIISMDTPALWSNLKRLKTASVSRAPG